MNYASISSVFFNTKTQSHKDFNDNVNDNFFWALRLKFN